MTVLSAVLLAVGAAVLGGLLGVLVMLGLRRQEQRRVAAAGITVREVLQQVFESSLTGIAVVDHFGDVLLHNPRAEQLGVVVNRRLEPSVAAAARTVLEHGRTTELDLSWPETHLRRTPMTVHLRERLLTDSGRRFVVIDANDESEQVRLEAARRDFVANVSHELKTPVGAMALQAEALLESADDPEAVRHFGGRLHHEARRLGALVTELIELSRLQGAERLPGLEIVDVDALVAEVLERTRLSAEAAGIEVTADAPRGLEVSGDRRLLLTALTNLVENAISYSPPGRAVSVSRALREGRVEVSVTDRGVGIPPDLHERVFERFFRVDPGRSRATGGTGLGLAIVKHVAANHNGDVRLWSRPGTGSTFTLRLPARVEDDGPAPGAHSGPDQEAPARPAPEPHRDDAPGQEPQ
ncbi:ATP-binding protein [Rhodococcus sp. X156]|uniref:sensor histidine kinase n=1 Tax=Rhodococcus sp. X156 TaxID=2499145 RepID=UPI000FD8B98D|nr:ATP-binding protein [Rhodococcus sp. X156]